MKLAQLLSHFPDCAIGRGLPYKKASSLQMTVTVKLPKGGVPERRLDTRLLFVIRYAPYFIMPGNQSWRSDQRLQCGQTTALL
jgi:hypothetical protein